VSSSFFQAAFSSPRLRARELLASVGGTSGKKKTRVHPGAAGALPPSPAYVPLTLTVDMALFNRAQRADPDFIPASTGGEAPVPLPSPPPPPAAADWVTYEDSLTVQPQPSLLSTPSPSTSPDRRDAHDLHLGAVYGGPEAAPESGTGTGGGTGGTEALVQGSNPAWLAALGAALRRGVSRRSPPSPPQPQPEPQRRPPSPVVVEGHNPVWVRALGAALGPPPPAPAEAGPSPGAAPADAGDSNVFRRPRLPPRVSVTLPETI